MIQGELKWRARELADAARAVGEEARTIKGTMYAYGVEDILRYLTGDAEASEMLQLIVDHESLS